MATQTILILESNPWQDLSLNQEIRDLTGVIERSRDRDKFRIKQGLAARTEDLQELMLKHKPQIVHFCGHGSGEGGLVLQDAARQPRAVATEALSKLFALCTDHLDCVVLNACYSEVQAEAIVAHVDYAIGMQQTIRDDAAQHFAQGFYRALGYGKSIELAYEFGCNAIQLMLSSEAEVRMRDSASPQRRKIGRKAVVEGSDGQELPEYLKPRLFKRDALLEVNLAEVEQPSGADLKKLGQVLEQEDALEQYREQVRKLLADQALSQVATALLRQFRRKLGLSEAEAAQILAEEEGARKEACEDYREIVMALIDAEAYPFDEKTLGELRQLQEQLKLTEVEVSRIEEPLFAKAEQALQSKWLKEGFNSFFFDTVFVDAAGKVAERQRRAAKSFVESLTNEVALEMVYIPGGEFWMGAADGEKGAYSCEHPRHLVQVSRFCLGKSVVTQAQYQVVMGGNPAEFKGEHRPVEQVSWEDAQVFCQKLSKIVGRAYRLPSEAEWEYACRAGTTLPFHFGETISTDLANYCGEDWKSEKGVFHSGRYGKGQLGSFRGKTIDVGSFPPNAFGLYDMHGNVWEWCADRWHCNYEGAPSDGSAWLADTEDEQLYVIRGGSHANIPNMCRSAYRIKVPRLRHSCRLGFRVMCEAPKS